MRDSQGSLWRAVRDGIIDSLDLTPDGHLHPCFSPDPAWARETAAERRKFEEHVHSTSRFGMQARPRTTSISRSPSVPSMPVVSTSTATAATTTTNAPVHVHRAPSTPPAKPRPTQPPGAPLRPQRHVFSDLASKDNVKANLFPSASSSPSSSSTAYLKTQVRILRAELWDEENRSERLSRRMYQVGKELENLAMDTN